MIKENQYQSKLIKKLHFLFPKSLILKNDEGYIQGIPDLIILNGKTWAALETKRCQNSSKRPNQEYYISLMNRMSYANFISPDNEEEIIRDLQQTFKSY